MDGWTSGGSEARGSSLSSSPGRALLGSMHLPSPSTHARDIVSLGEVLLRFDPGEFRVEQCRNFRVWEGGAEYNVARNLASCFGQRAACVTWLVDNPVGRLIENLMAGSGVDLSEVVWCAEEDGALRNGLNFVERGFGVRAPRGMSDRAYTAARSALATDVDWSALLSDQGTRIFHTGGVFVSLTPQTAAVAQHAMTIAQESGSVVSFDLNYRDSLWRHRGGKAAADALCSDLLTRTDICFGVMDLTLDDHADRARVEEALHIFKQRHPALSYVVTNLRVVRDHSHHAFGGACLGPGGFSYVAPREISILDRVGGGDGFASGFLFGLLEGLEEHVALEYGVAHGALVMSTPGDNSMARLEDVEALARSLGSAEPGMVR